MDKYRISSTGNSINYLPQYVAERNGYFEEQGLDVETDIPNPWPKVLDDIDSGEYHAVCGGIWVPSMYSHHNIENYSCFAKISSLCPFKLVSREKIEDFDWKDLEGKTVLVPCDGGASAYIFLAGTMKDKGVDLNKVHFIHDFIDNMLYDGFTKGTLGDFYFTQAAKADQIVSEKKGNVVSEMSTEGIKNPWSVYYTTIETANDERKLNHRFALALQKGLDWLLNNDTEDLKDILEERWPGVDVNISMETVDRFKEQGMWAESIEIIEDEYLNYANYQVAAKIIDEPVPYKKLVDLSVLDYVKENTK